MKKTDPSAVVVYENDSTGIAVISVLFIIAIIALLILLPKWKPGFQW